MTKGRTSKVVEFGLEQEVIELLKQGLGPKIIADTLNSRHTLTVPLNHVNIIAFRDSLPGAVYKAIQNEHLDRFYVKPIEKLRGEMEMLRERTFPALLQALNENDVRKVRILEKAFMDTWDRIARMEEVINPTGEMKAKVIHIQQQFNIFKEHLEQVFGKLCPSCREMVLRDTEFKTSPLVVDAVIIEETKTEDHAAPEAEVPP